MIVMHVLVGGAPSSIRTASGKSERAGFPPRLAAGPQIRNAPRARRHARVAQGLRILYSSRYRGRPGIGFCRRAASSTFTVPCALIEKSSRGLHDGSCDGDLHRPGETRSLRPPSPPRRPRSPARISFDENRKRCRCCAFSQSRFCCTPARLTLSNNTTSCPSRNRRSEQIRPDENLDPACNQNSLINSSSYGSYLVATANVHEFILNYCFSAWRSVLDSIGTPFR